MCYPSPEVPLRGPACGLWKQGHGLCGPAAPGIWVCAYRILFLRPGCSPALACDGAVAMLPMDAAFSSMTDSHGRRTASSTGLRPTYHVLPAAVRPQGTVQHFWEEPPHDRTTSDTAGICGQFDARRAWPVEALVEPPSYPYWVLAPGSMAVSRRWPVERFAALAKDIAHTTGLSGLVVGGTAEVAVANQLCQDPAHQLTDFTARGPVAAYWQVLRQALFTVSNDSGLAHVAALCGSPVYIVWGAGDPGKTKPLGPGPVRILHYPVDCWPCERNVCLQPPERTIACLRRYRF